MTTSSSRDWTTAALAREAATAYTSTVAMRHKRADEWIDITYDELWARVRRLALGLVALGVDAGDRVCILAGTRVEWTVSQLAVNAAGAIAVPIYASNAPDECWWVASNSGAVAVVCENDGQAAKIAAVRDRLPDLRHVILIDGEDGETLESIGERGRDDDEAELHGRIEDVTTDDPCLIIYTSGTTGRPKGVVLTNRNLAAGGRMFAELGLLAPGDVDYLFLPLAHAFAHLMQFGGLAMGITTAYFGGDSSRIVPELAEVKPTVLPSVPRIFEKIYTVAVGAVPADETENLRRAVDVGVRLRREAAGAGPAGSVSTLDRESFDAADEQVFARVRAIFGGRLRVGISGGAPIAPDILRFFYAAGAPVFEGWAMTEMASVGTLNTPRDVRFGTVGKPEPGVEIELADDGEILARGPMNMKGYWRNPEATAEAFTDDGFLRTGDLGSIDEDGFVRITGRKKEIIITAGGKNLTPANLEGDLRQSRWISQAIMYADRRPYPVALITLDAEEVVQWAAARGMPTDIARLATDPAVRELVQQELDAVNARYASVEQIKKFLILPHDLSQDAGELTPTLKVKRNVVYDRYLDEFEALYR